MTTLASWQARVGGRLLAGDRPEPDTGTPAREAGWPVTLALYRQWRVDRIRTLAPLTLAWLGDHAELVLDAFLATHPSSGSDAAEFLRFAAAAQPEDHCLDEITFLERAVITARQPASAERPAPAGYLTRGRRASLRRLPFPPIRLMLWLAGRAGPPAAHPGGIPVLVAPDHTGWIRPATEAEAAVWHWLAMDRPAHLAESSWAEPIATLCRAGAIS